MNEERDNHRPQPRCGQPSNLAETPALSPVNRQSRPALLPLPNNQRPVSLSQIPSIRVKPTGAFYIPTENADNSGTEWPTGRNISFQVYNTRETQTRSSLQSPRSQRFAQGASRAADPFNHYTRPTTSLPSEGDSDVTEYVAESNINRLNIIAEETYIPTGPHHPSNNY